MDTATNTSSKSQPVIADLVRRIWACDYSLWPEPSPGGGSNWMGWLDLPGASPSRGTLAETTRTTALSGITSLNILGMGGSSLTPEVLSRLIPESKPSLNVFDTVNPYTIGEAIDKIDLRSAAFVVASKSGTTVEPLSLESVFRRALKNRGIDDVSSHFVAMSDPGTPLASRAETGQFALHIETPTNVGGRFSALSAFGMFPAEICNMPIDEMKRSASKMAASCRTENHTNPGFELGMFMASNALRGRDKVTFAMSPGLERFGLWIEQLLAESTGKNNRGLIPVAGEPELPPTSYGVDRQFIRITLAGEPRPDNPAFDDHPTYDIELPDRAAIAGEFFRWEFATAVAACAIGVYPFDQPDVESAKQLARKALESNPDRRAYSESITDAIDSVLASVEPGNYIAIAAYLPESSELTDAVSRLRAAISESTGIATTFGYGPRYLHSTGQLHKGGPNSVTLLALTQKIEPDIQVPDQNYTLGQLLNAQATGDVQALHDIGRRAHLVNLEADPIKEIDAMTAKIHQ